MSASVRSVPSPVCVCVCVCLCSWFCCLQLKHRAPALGLGVRVGLFGRSVVVPFARVMNPCEHRQAEQMHTCTNANALLHTHTHTLSHTHTHAHTKQWIHRLRVVAAHLVHWRHLAQWRIAAAKWRTGTSCHSWKATRARSSNYLKHSQDPKTGSGLALPPLVNWQRGPWRFNSPCCQKPNVQKPYLGSFARGRGKYYSTAG